jgi:peptidyl-prolyl cis-trans isomerase SurA
MDPGSAFKGGELGMFGRNQMVPEFEAAAFKLRPDSISKIIETQYGYHILKLIERKGDMVNVRHILIKPQTGSIDLELAKKFLDSLRFQINADSIKFEDAARLYNDDETMKMTNGLLSDYTTGSTRIPADMMEKDLFFTIEGMKEGDISEPKLFKTQEEVLGYRVVYLKKFYPPHRCNLKDDYQKIQEMSLGQKKQKAMEDWVNKNRKDIYVWINPKYAQCPLLQKWVAKP